MMTATPVIHAVEDDRRFREALERTLRTTGFPVQGYSCASAFLNDLDPSAPGCLVTDLRMPGMDGLELQKTLRERQIRLSIIFISGHGDATQAIAALKGGAIDFLEKPFGEQTLLRCVARALDKDSADRRLAAERAIVMQRFANLTPREQEIFALVVSDLPKSRTRSGVLCPGLRDDDAFHCVDDPACRGRMHQQFLGVLQPHHDYSDHQGNPRFAGTHSGWLPGTGSRQHGDRWRHV
jgi:two-component system response regulator FixJ